MNNDDREKEIRALCKIVKLPELADDLVASNMTDPQVRDLLTTVTALLDEAKGGQFGETVRPMEVSKSNSKSARRLSRG